ncbi:hypothetical protein CsSME_00029385 [Camellia sinensis var. sinensis]
MLQAHHLYLERAPGRQSKTHPLQREGTQAVRSPYSCLVMFFLFSLFPFFMFSRTTTLSFFHFFFFFEFSKKWIVFRNFFQKKVHQTMFFGNRKQKT